MATKTANLYARIDPETKASAEAVLEALGIPVSTAINMFYRQIIMSNGLPFSAQLPANQPIKKPAPKVIKKPLNLSDISNKKFNEEMEIGFQSLNNSEGYSIEEAFNMI